MDKELIRILIVDDHEIIRLGLKVILEKCPDLLVVGEAENGEKALKVAQECHPHVILMDVAMPEVDGIESVRRIKATTPEVRVLMVTTHDHDDDVFAAFSAGADGYCLKDSAGDQIAIAIRAVNNGVAWFDAGIAAKVLGAMKGAKTPDKVITKPDTSRSNVNKFNLTPREIEILELLVDGSSNQQMADTLVISTETVKTHMRHIMEKLVVSDRTQAAVKALKEGLLRPAER